MLLLCVDIVFSLLLLLLPHLSDQWKRALKHLLLLLLKLPFFLRLCSMLLLTRVLLQLMRCNNLS